jgi:flagellar protein FliO/FliZ
MIGSDYLDTGSITFMNNIDYIKFILAFTVVLGLIWLLGLVSKKLNLSQLGIKMSSSGPKRLQIISMQALDTRHRLVLVRRDNTEHLLAVSPDRVTVIEQHIAPPVSTISSEEQS